MSRITITVAVTITVQHKTVVTNEPQYDNGNGNDNDNGATHNGWQNEPQSRASAFSPGIKPSRQNKCTAPQNEYGLRAGKRGQALTGDLHTRGGAFTKYPTMERISNLGFLDRGLGTLGDRGLYTERGFVFFRGRGACTAVTPTTVRWLEIGLRLNRRSANSQK